MSRVAHFIRDNSHYLRFWDQCALNGVLTGEWSPLDPTWNVFPFRDLGAGVAFPYLGEDVVAEHRLQELEQNAGLYHFVGDRKPWLTGDKFCSLAHERALDTYHGFSELVANRVR